MFKIEHDIMNDCNEITLLGWVIPDWLGIFLMDIGILPSDIE